MTEPDTGRNWRERLLDRIEVLVRSDVVEQARAAGVDDPDAVGRWKRSGEVLSFNVGGVELFPTFQFDGARPWPTVAEALRALPAGISTTQAVKWFLARDPGLNGRAPAEVLDDRDAVIGAALREAGRRGG